jgi:hypothetical protein
MLVPPNGKIGSEVSESCLVPRLQLSSTKHAWVGVTASCTKDRSFVEVLQSKPRLELEDWSRIEAEKGRVTQRLVVEYGLDVPMLVASSARKIGAIPSNFGSISC